MFFVQTVCPMCTTGKVGFRRCAPGLHIVLMCDDCNSVWLQPDGVFADTALYPQAPDFVVPTLHCSIRRPLSDWARREEIAQAHWEQFIYGEGKALDEP